MGLDINDWNYLCQIADENGTRPEVIASEMLCAEIKRHQEFDQYVALQEMKQASDEMVLENRIDAEMCS